MGSELDIDKLERETADMTSTPWAVAPDESKKWCDLPAPQSVVAMNRRIDARGITALRNARDAIIAALRDRDSAIKAAVQSDREATCKELCLGCNKGLPLTTIKHIDGHDVECHQRRRGSDTQHCSTVYLRRHWAKEGA